MQGSLRRLFCLALVGLACVAGIVSSHSAPALAEPPHHCPGENPAAYWDFSLCIGPPGAQVQMSVGSQVTMTATSVQVRSLDTPAKFAPILINVSGASPWTYAMPNVCVVGMANMPVEIWVNAKNIAGSPGNFDAGRFIVTCPQAPAAPAPARATEPPPGVKAPGVKPPGT